MPVTRNSNEAGFTMISVILGLTVVFALSVVAVSTVSSDIGLNRYDLERKRAYEAAKAGINDYLFHLHNQTDYWTECDEVAKPVNNAVNQVGSTAKRRPVPGGVGDEYAIEMLPAAGQAQYTECSTIDPGGSMLEPAGLMKGTFRIRSTGFSGRADVSIVATFKPATFLDYVYFTQRETLDPVTYGYPDPSLQLTGAKSQCSKPLVEKDASGKPLSIRTAGRASAPMPNTGGRYCTVISFAASGSTNDVINGPMHTNDVFVICGNPTLGRGPADPIEVSGPPKGWFSTREVTNDSRDCSGSSSNFKGTYTADSPVINPPPSNSALSSIAGLRFKGQVRICLSGSNVTVGAGSSCTDDIQYSGPLPGNGVIYIEHDVACSESYSPFNLDYGAIEEETESCGNAYVHGEFSEQLTIGTENDIVVDGDLTHTGEGVLGLIANNFVRVYHPVDIDEDEYGNLECDGNDPSTPTDIEIDAAILAIDHSFIVDNYDCGDELGKLTVRGAIAMKYRGPTGLINSSGYEKDYNYDDRLRYLQPPSFIEPAESDWVIGRQTIE